MAKQTIELTTLLKRQEQLAARIAAVKARTSAQQRKDDTRRKILAGSYMLYKLEKNGGFEKLVAELDSFLLKPNDRALFGLPPLTESKVLIEST